MTGNNLKTEQQWYNLGYMIKPEEEALHLNHRGEPLYRYDQVEDDYDWMEEIPTGELDDAT